MFLVLPQKEEGYRKSSKYNFDSLPSRCNIWKGFLFEAV